MIIRPASDIFDSWLNLNWKEGDIVVCAKLCRGLLGVFWRLAIEARPVLISAKPSLRPESGAFAVV